MSVDFKWKFKCSLYTDESGIESYFAFFGLAGSTTEEKDNYKNYVGIIKELFQFF